MQTYKARRPPEPPRGGSIEDLIRWAGEMHQWAVEDSQAVEKAAHAGSDSVPVNYLSAAPDRPKNGIYHADGTNWNPGSGKGAYRYDESTATYTFFA